jgi:hypothetical protein
MTRSKIAHVMLFLSALVLQPQHLVESLSNPKPKLPSCDPNSLSTRRAMIGAGVYSALFFGVTKSDTSHAFPNKISTMYDDRPKRRGPQVSKECSIMLWIHISTHLFATALVTLMLISICTRIDSQTTLV